MDYKTEFNGYKFGSEDKVWHGTTGSTFNLDSGEMVLKDAKFVSSNMDFTNGSDKPAKVTISVGKNSIEITENGIDIQVGK
ncbi:hypothetical protein [Oceanobacillus sp. FSL H7-0719]|uniref:hypothetical protein n=1 Tax=Oceanobacillus sp. FSL H7-0719 TaxID=2954507 RepID=UPI00324FE820